MTIETVVFDLDGVVRHFDREHEARLEDEYGLQRGALLRAAFGDELGRRLVTGVIDWPEYEMTLAERLPHGLVAEFAATRAVLDTDAVRLVDELRADGRRVALLTNGTYRTEEELAEHGIGDRFDVVFNTARIGIAKPSPEIYRHVTERLAVEPRAVGFVDDHEPNVAAAAQFGWHAHLYRNLDDVRSWLAVHLR